MSHAAGAAFPVKELLASRDLLPSSAVATRIRFLYGFLPLFGHVTPTQVPQKILPKTSLRWDSGPACPPWKGPDCLYSEGYRALLQSGLRLLGGFPRSLKRQSQAPIFICSKRTSRAPARAKGEAGVLEVASPWCGPKCQETPEDEVQGGFGPTRSSSSSSLLEVLKSTNPTDRRLLWRKKKIGRNVSISGFRYALQRP